MRKGLTYFVQRFLDADTSTMENMFSLDGLVRSVSRYSDEDVMSSMNVLLDPIIFQLVLTNPKRHLPLLYSLAMAFPYTNGARSVV